MARLPEGALMQRAAHGLAHAVLDLLGSAYGRRVLLLVGSGDNGGDALYAGAVLARRGVQVDGLAAVRARARGGPGRAPRPRRRPASTGAAARPARPGRRRHRRHRRAARAATRRPRGRSPRSPACRSWPSTRPAASTSTPASSTARTSRADAHRHLRHPQGRPPGRPGRQRVPARCTWSTSASTCRRRRVEALQPADVARAAAAARRRRAEVHPRGRRRPRRLGALPRRRPALASPARAAGWPGMVRYVGDDAVARPGPRRSTPRSSARAGCRPGWSARGGGDGAGATLAAGARRRRTARRRRRRAGARSTGRSGAPRSSPRTPASWPGCSASTAPTSRRRPLHHARQRRRRLRRHRAAQGPPHPRRRTPTAGCGSPPPAPRGWPPPAPATCWAGWSAPCSPPGSTPFDAASVGSWLHGRRRDPRRPPAGRSPPARWPRRSPSGRGTCSRGRAGRIGA